MPPLSNLGFILYTTSDVLIHMNTRYKFECTNLGPNLVDILVSITTMRDGLICVSISHILHSELAAC